MSARQLLIALKYLSIASYDAVFFPLCQNCCPHFQISSLVAIFLYDLAVSTVVLFHNAVIAYQHVSKPGASLSYDVCVEVRGKIIRTVLCCIVYGAVHSHQHT